MLGTHQSIQLDQTEAVAGNHISMNLVQCRGQIHCSASRNTMMRNGSISTFIHSFLNISGLIAQPLSYYQLARALLQVKFSKLLLLERYLVSSPQPTNCLFLQIVNSHTPAASTEETQTAIIFAWHSESSVGNSINRMWPVTILLSFSLWQGPFSLSGISTVKVQFEWRQIAAQWYGLKLAKPPRELDVRFPMSFCRKPAKVIAQHVLKFSGCITAQSQKEA